MVTGNQEREKILALEARNSCAIKYPFALRVPERAENEKGLHGDEHGEALCVGLWQLHFMWKTLCASSVVMVQPSQDRNRNHCASFGRRDTRCSSFPLRNLLPHPLMRPYLVEIGHIGMEHTVELPLLQDEQVIEALASHTAQEALTDGIGSRRVVGRFEDLDATGLGNPRESHAKLAIVIPDEILRPHTKGRSFAKLLGHPGVSGRACHADVDHLTRVQEGVEEGKQRAEEQVSHRKKVAGPDLLGMGTQERLPGLSMWSCGAHSSHVFLNSALTNVDAQLEQFATNTLCSPESVVPGHLLDQGHRFLGNPWDE